MSDDRDLIERAAAELRHRVAQAQYAGGIRPDVAFGHCLILDELAAHLRDVSDELRAAAVACSRQLLHGSEDDRR